MGPNTSHITKENSKSKKNSAAETNEIPSITAVGDLEFSDSFHAPIKLVTSLAGVDFTREYHGVDDNEYILPSDAGEQDRLELQVLLTS
ncbi:hypothetical protein HK100_011213 [Physocladia obscura]|uniref:Uncharacterized protein n=1 Tax=Physocladia obscura TaxID=109957 RepID=A0AAD5XH48_9FUNG|nr:hypothetical protein HK100_011213 [Physocladia obscura]